MLDYYGDKVGVPIARKHIAWYSRGLPGSADFRSQLMRLSESKVVRQSILGFWAAAQDRLAA